MTTGDAYETLRNEALTELAQQPNTTRDGVRDLVAKLVERYQVRSTSGLGGRPLTRPREMAERLERSLLDYGPLTPFFDGSLRYEELIIHGDEVSYVNDSGQLAIWDEPVTDAEVVHIVSKLLAEVGVAADDAHPMVQAQVLDGKARLGVVLPPIADRIDVTVRRYLSKKESFDDLIAWDALTPEVANLLSIALRSGAGIIVCGQPGSGKTTLVNALLRSAPSHLRVIACEETPELAVEHLNAARWKTRPPGPDGSGGIDLRYLVKMSLGMRPDIIAVGEVRGSEAYELTRAGNAGVAMVSTIHANSARQGLQALVSTAVMAGPNVAPEQVRAVFSSIVDLVVYVGKEPSASGQTGRRQVLEVVAIPSMQASDTDFSVEPIFVRDDFGQPLRWTRNPLPAELEVRLNRVLRPHQLTAAALLEGRRLQEAR